MIMVDIDEGVFTDTKPGWQTTEFWLTVASLVVGFLSTQQVFPEDSIFARGLTVAATILTALGYTVARSVVKRESVKQQAEFLRLHSTKTN
jgi:hypothetical protein